MKTILRATLLAMACTLVAAAPVLADITNGGAQNIEEGDNSSDNDQAGESQSGDAVAGQVTGVVSAGDAEVDATNHSSDADVGSGDVEGSNSSASFTGLNATQTVTIVSDIEAGPAFNVQEGDNDSEIVQAADLASGDGVGGQVTGVVTSAGGSADVVAANTSDDVDVDTGDVDGDNDVAALVGHVDFAPSAIFATDIVIPRSGAFPPGIVHEGDNDGSFDQSAVGSSGDGVAGQVLGVVSAGDTSLDATNSSEDLDVDTGDALADNDAAAFVGSTIGTETLVVADISVDDAFNVQEGDNDAAFVQAAEAASGDGVGGQVVGAVTSAGGSADIVGANTSEDVDVDTGDATALNEAAAFVGHHGQPAGALEVADVDADAVVNVQEGDNDFEADQSAAAATGDGVLGQVLGVVSAGDASVDAANVSEDSDAESGDADAANDVASFVGLVTATGSIVSAADIDAGTAFNVQEGDNEGAVVQAANAASGDAVGGQVGGVVTSAGGSADLVLANSSEDTDTQTGDTDDINDALSITGLVAPEFLTAT